MTKFADLFAALASPFDTQDVKSRSQAGRQFYYVTARTVMNRLDEVLGPENWWDQFFPNEHSVVCGLTIRLPDGQTITKFDAGGYAGMSDQGDDDKSGYSDAFKRAAVKFGVARYLYRDGVPGFVRDRVSQPVALAPPAEARPEPRQDAAPPPRRESNGNGGGPAPRSGRALFAWAAEAKEDTGVDVVAWLGKWGERAGVGSKVTQWPEAAVADAYAAAVKAIDRHLATTEGGNDD